jgi:hypothetical protein
MRAQYAHSPKGQRTTVRKLSGTSTAGAAQTPMNGTRRHSSSPLHWEQEMKTSKNGGIALIRHMSASHVPIPSRGCLLGSPGCGKTRLRQENLSRLLAIDLSQSENHVRS